jgi:hypothetical protein
MMLTAPIWRMKEEQMSTAFALQRYDRGAT